MALRGMEDRGVDGVRDHLRIAQLEPELEMLLEAVARLENGRVSQRAVDRRDATVRAVVETAIHADRAVDPVHHHGVGPGEPPKPREVEVERVEEAGGRVRRQSVVLDFDASTVELTRKSTEELVTASGGRRRELVEQRELRPPAARPKPVGLGAGSGGELPAGTANRPGNAAKLHAEHANVACRAMPSPGRLSRVLLRGRVPIRTRFDLLRAEIRRRVRPKPAYGLRYGPGHVFLSHCRLRGRLGVVQVGRRRRRVSDRLRGCRRARSRGP